MIRINTFKYPAFLVCHFFFQLPYNFWSLIFLLFTETCMSSFICVQLLHVCNSSHRRTCCRQCLLEACKVVLDGHPEFEAIETFNDSFREFLAHSVRRPPKAPEEDSAEERLPARSFVTVLAKHLRLFQHYYSQTLLTSDNISNQIPKGLVTTPVDETDMMQSVGVHTKGADVN